MMIITHDNANKFLLHFHRDKVTESTVGAEKEKKDFCGKRVKRLNMCEMNSALLSFHLKRHIWGNMKQAVSAL